MSPCSWFETIGTSQAVFVVFNSHLPQSFILNTNPPWKLWNHHHNFFLVTNRRGARQESSTLLRRKSASLRHALVCVASRLIVGINSVNSRCQLLRCALRSSGEHLR
ncbi:hypothetical protein Bca4012_063225 [Brassica carinata]